MRKLPNGVIIIGEEVPDQVCSECKKSDECRPYGRNGALLCYGCAMSPKNKTVVERNVCQILTGRKSKNKR